MRKHVKGYVMGEDRTEAEGKYIMLDIHDIALVQKLHECLIDRASLAMDNKEYTDAAAYLNDANDLEDVIKEYCTSLKAPVATAPGVNVIPL